MNKTLIISFLCISSIMMKINGAAQYDPMQHLLQRAITRYDAQAVIAHLQANPYVTGTTIDVLHQEIKSIQQRNNNFSALLPFLPSLNDHEVNTVEQMGEWLTTQNNAIDIMYRPLLDAYNDSIQKGSLLQQYDAFFKRLLSYPKLNKLYPKRYSKLSKRTLHAACKAQIDICLEEHYAIQTMHSPLMNAPRASTASFPERGSQYRTKQLTNKIQMKPCS
ncbi:MAG TPA: hypothetical protein VGT41_01205 [Candidatus Babeliales bacterium]|nr:hypothetical protein [Candidatus Babeliales bacterium]